MLHVIILGIQLIGMIHILQPLKENPPNADFREIQAIILLRDSLSSGMEMHGSGPANLMGQTVDLGLRERISPKVEERVKVLVALEQILTERHEILPYLASIILQSVSDRSNVINEGDIMDFVESILNYPAIIKIIGGFLLALGSYLVLIGINKMEKEDYEFRNRVRRNYSRDEDEN